ncbi:MAG: DUF4157 domain-containing protein, partial [Actinobacteria bacterium]|nr:DUF4157 domain-containing protein [Actinomycetota bacterium]
MAPALPGEDDDRLGSRRSLLGDGGGSERGGGSALDPTTRAGLEPTLGADLSGVRVHTGPAADQLSQAVEAEAFTTGQDIFFREGRYDPGSQSGQALLAHEATHTVQQARGPVSGQDWGGGVQVSDPNDAFEREANATAQQAVQRLAAPHDAGAPQAGEFRPLALAPGSTPVVQRKESEAGVCPVCGRRGVGTCACGQPFLPAQRLKATQARPSLDPLTISQRQALPLNRKPTVAHAQEF